MMWLLLAVCAAAIAYQLTALFATLRHLARRDPEPRLLPPVSILKPVHGLDRGFYAAIRSHATQEYPEFEILFGFGRSDDPAIPDIERLRSEFPGVPMRLVRSTRQAPNGKAGVLTDLAAQARHGVLLVNDSDIVVPPGYLRQVVVPLEDASAGLVTCLYRASSLTMPGIWEAIGIATDFAPSTLVAPLAGVKEFGLGSTLVFRADDLRAIGGFPAIEDYLADDYQLARRITLLGKRVHLSRTVVETALGGESWGEAWRHQLRWHRTIRFSRAGYAGLPITHATFWALIAAACGLWAWAVALLIARMAMGITAGVGLLGCRLTARYWFLIPLRDLWGSAVWVAGLFGNTVVWRGQLLRLDREGRIQR